MENLENKSKSMFSNETLDSMAMAEVYGGAAVGIGMEAEAAKYSATYCKCPVHTYCPSCDTKCDACKEVVAISAEKAAAVALLSSVCAFVTAVSASVSFPFSYVQSTFSLQEAKVVTAVINNPVFIAVDFFIFHSLQQSVMLSINSFK